MVYMDDVNETVAELVDFHVSKGRTIIMLSGRDSICMDDTRVYHSKR